MGFLDKLSNKSAKNTDQGVSPAQQSAKHAPATNPAQPSAPSAPANADSKTTQAAGGVPQDSSAKAQPSAPTDVASLSKAKQFVEAFKGRRSIYALGKRQVISDKETIDLIKSCVRESPSSFNSQSSRVVILLGDAHDAYWKETVTGELRKVVSDEEKFKHGKDRLDGFAGAYGTVLFFEDEAVVEQFQKNISSYADRFPEWSTHASGIAQIHTWDTLELAGFGANLQHYGNLSGPAIISKLGLSNKWKLHAELVFGSPEGPAGEKAYMDDAERFKIFGAST